MESQQAKQREREQPRAIDKCGSVGYQQIIKNVHSHASRRCAQLLQPSSPAVEGVVCLQRSNTSMFAGTLRRLAGCTAVASRHEARAVRPAATSFAMRRCSSVKPVASTTPEKMDKGSVSRPGCGPV